MVRTAWGDSLEVEPRKFIGGHLYMRGVHELPVCEALWRLAEPGEIAVDVGANIGVMTSVLSKKVGGRGQVIAFEAHPGVVRELESNIQRWRSRRIDIVHRAVSCGTGKLCLNEGEWFGLNEGTASVTDAGQGPSFEVFCVSLDEVLAESRYGVIKIDVEGHEWEVLSGCKRLLESHRVRDIVFESGWEFPGPAHNLLSECGYAVFDLGAGFTRPLLTEPRRRAGNPARVRDYLATANPERAHRLLHAQGWRVLCAV